MTAIATKYYGMFPDRMVTLSEDARSMLVHCLRGSAVKYLEISEEWKKEHPSFSSQLQMQAEQATELADRIENAEYVKLGRIEESYETE